VIDAQAAGIQFTRQAVGPGPVSQAGAHQGGGARTGNIATGGAGESVHGSLEPGGHQATQAGARHANVGDRFRGVQAQSLVGEEEGAVRPVVQVRNHNRAGEGAAEVVLPQGRLRFGSLVEVHTGVHRIVAEIVVDRTVKTVGAASRGEDELATGRASIFSGVGRSERAELLQGIQRDKALRGAERRVSRDGAREASAPARRVEGRSSRIRRNSIHGEVICLGTLAIYRKLPVIVGKHRRRGHGYGAGNHRDQRLQRAAIEREIFDKLVIDHRADAGIGGIQLHAGAVHGHSLLFRTDLKFEIESGFGRCLQNDVVRHTALKFRCRHGYNILSRRQS